jgi:hypothetical protein
MSLGRDLVAAEPEDWIEIHRATRPETLAALEDALGRRVAAVLSGEKVVRISRGSQGPEGPSRVKLVGLSEKDCEIFSARLSIPAIKRDRVPAGSVDLRSIRLPETVRTSPRWAMSLAGTTSYIEFTTLDSMICQRFLAPVMGDLAYIFSLRAGDGPKTAKARADRLARCEITHRALGLAVDPLKALLDPNLTADAVVTCRSAVVAAWAAHPQDLGERVMALLCARLAQAYYAKARKDGTVEAARVMTANVTPVLESTLGDWETLVGYLGETQASADQSPVVTPKVTLPGEAPSAIAERLAVLREWWRVYDTRHAAQCAGMASLKDLVPSRWDYSTPGQDPTRPGGLARRALPPDLLARAEQLWGWQVLPSQPDVLVNEPRPLGVMAELLQPAASFWDELSLAAWCSCFGSYFRYTLDQLEDAQRDSRDALADLGAPVETRIYGDLLKLTTRYPFLLEAEGYSVGITFEIDVDDVGDTVVSSRMDDPERRSHPEVFEILRDLITEYRQGWLSEHLDHYLEHLWRRELTAAAEAYWKRYRGRGKAPTVKQALPDVARCAQRWFGADHGALARLLALDGAIDQSPMRSSRALPEDVPALEHEVAERLLEAARPLDDESYRQWAVARLAGHATTVLIAWQASGCVPPRSSVLASSSRQVVDQTFGCNLDDAYTLLLAATHAALERRGHPAATAIVPNVTAMVPGAAENVWLDRLGGRSKRVVTPQQQMTPFLLQGDEIVDAVGESFYQSALLDQCRAQDGNSVRLPCRAQLIAEPDNPYDRHAVAVEIGGQLVGYLSRRDAPIWQPIVKDLADRGYAAACEAMIARRGPEGETDNLGVFLHLPTPTEARAELALMVGPAEPR